MREHLNPFVFLQIQRSCFLWMDTFRQSLAGRSEQSDRRFINRAVKPRPLGRGYKALWLLSKTGTI